MRRSLRRHPATVGLHHVAAVRIHGIELFCVAFGKQIASERIQKHGVRPVPFCIEQVQVIRILRRMYAATDKFFQLAQIAILNSSATTHPVSALIEFPAPRPGP